MTANLSLSDIGAIPSNYAQTNDPTIFQNDEVWLDVKCSNQGSESGQFKVLMTLEGYTESHEEWIRNMQPGEEKWLTWTISPDHLSAGNQKFDVYADVTSRVDESNELDNHLEGILHGHGRKSPRHGQHGGRDHRGQPDRRRVDQGRLAPRSCPSALR